MGALGLWASKAELGFVVLGVSGCTSKKVAKSGVVHGFLLLKVTFFCFLSLIRFVKEFIRF